MDPLSALAIAAATFQFLELGGKLCIKAWEKYKHIQLKIPDDQKLAEEEKELKQTFEDLSSQISWFRNVSTRIVASQPPTPAEVQLLKISSQCASLASDFERIESRLKLPNSRELNSEIHLRNHVGLSLILRWNIPEERCTDCQKRKDEENAEFQRNKEDFERIRRKLEPLKRDIMNSILLSLWDDSKRTQQWELHFSSQLDKLIELLGSAEKLPVNNPPKSALSNQKESTQDRDHDFGNRNDCTQQCGIAISTAADEEAARLENALQPLIQLRKGPGSLKQLAEDMTKYLKTDNGAMNLIHEELVNLLWKNDWKNDWKLDTSMASSKVDTTMVAHAIATGIQFSNIQTREDAIAKTFETTYSWIFQDEPTKKDEMPRWNSFPKWLKDDNEKVYWITGKPGSGKSTMMKMILQETSVRGMLSQSLGTLRLLLVKYYAWLPGDALQKSIEGLKRTIIYQALKQYPDLAPVVTPRRWAFCQTLRRISGLPAWDAWEVEESFEELLSSCGETIKLALFIDGLDEFDTPAVEIIKWIQNITAKCNSALKICAASRPWTEFQDEFDESPMLQMHLLTENDMETFVNKIFKNNKGFVEQSKLNPEAASGLLAEIVQRAKGVFLWVSIVVQHLSSFFSDGQSIFQTRQTLEVLPTDISSLYDTIWAGIRPDNLPDASYMIQVLRAFRGPVPWFTMWLIDELRFSTKDKMDLPNYDMRKVALRSLQRKLSARTKCFLEISGNYSNGSVDFIHRTARDWAAQPGNWQLICSSSSEEFDPHLCIVKAEALRLTDVGYSTGERDVRIAAARLLWHASEVRDIPKNTLDLIGCLESRKYTIEASFEGNVTPVDKLRDTWKEGIALFRKIEARTSLLELAAQFSILPYIKAAALSDRTHLSPSFSKHSIGLLESAIFGYSYYTDLLRTSYLPRTPRDRKLATVKYLLDQGVRQTRMAANEGEERSNIRKRLREVSSKDPEYYSAVEKYLDEMNLQSSVRSIELRVRSLFSKEKW